jgi:hypothetical protein
MMSRSNGLLTYIGLHRDEKSNINATDIAEISTWAQRSKAKFFLPFEADFGTFSDVETNV